mgnify:CR=1 FL=1
MAKFTMELREIISTFGEDFNRCFVDFLKKADQRYWQLLPIGPTGYGDSPYSSFSKRYIEFKIQDKPYKDVIQKIL